MVKLKSKQEFLSLCQKAKESIKWRYTNESSNRYFLSINTNNENIIEKINFCLKELNLDKNVEVTFSSVVSFSLGTTLKIYPDQTFYVKLQENDVERILKEHLINHVVVEDLLYKTSAREIIENESEIDFFKYQSKNLLSYFKCINPESISECIANGSYQSFIKCLFELNPDNILKEIEEASLKERGSESFFVANKWKIIKNTSSEKKYIICNANESDTNSLKDKYLIECNPHQIIESLLIEGYTVGSDEGIIYLNLNNSLAIKRMQIAISQAYELGLLGNNILGSDFSFNINIKLSPGTFLYSEETSLIHSLEGIRPEPTVKSPSIEINGLFNKPTCVNNVETLFNIPLIVLNGGKAFKNSETKLLNLTGKVINEGLIEVKLSSSIDDIVFKIGGGIKNRNTFKAIQFGGPTGHYFSKKELESINDLNNITFWGSSTINVFDDSDCIIDKVKENLEFICNESCGKCSPCRIGNKRALEIINRICEGNGLIEDLAILKELSEVINVCSLCEFGKTSSYVVESTLNNFFDEYLSHINNKKCPAGVCKKLLSYKIIIPNCLGCGMCARNCPVSAIEKTDQFGKNPRLNAYQIDSNKCIKCGTCYTKCPAKPKAIER